MYVSFLSLYLVQCWNIKAFGIYSIKKEAILFLGSHSSCKLDKDYVRTPYLTPQVAVFTYGFK